MEATMQHEITRLTSENLVSCELTSDERVSHHAFSWGRMHDEVVR